MHTRRRFIRVGLVLFLAGFAGCSERVPAAPRSLAADQIGGAIRALPREAHFSLSGAVFFKGKLYVSSNVGLLVIAGGKPETLYKWFKRDDVVEGPWLDAANDMMWIQHAHDNSLSRFDGAAWHAVALPAPPSGFTRGDVLRGFLGISGPDAFWLVGGGHVWRFHAKGTAWVPEPEPPAPNYSAIRAVARLDASMLYIVREGIEVIPPSEYAVYNREDNWARQNLSEKMDFGSVVTNAEGAYVRAKDGRLFLIRPESIQILETPGLCEAITKTSTGKLLASFVDQGIFLLDNHAWELRASYPYGKQEGEHWAYLAEANGQIAYVTSSVPQIQANDRFTYSGSVALWFQSAGKLERILLN